MTNGKGKALNLDELFGTADPVLVVYQDRQYELARPAAWSPEQYSQYMRLQRSLTWTELESAMETPEAFEKLMETLKKMLFIISPELAALNLSFDKQTKIIDHYARIVFPDEVAKVESKLKNPTGA